MILDSVIKHFSFFIPTLSTKAKFPSLSRIIIPKVFILSASIKVFFIIDRRRFQLRAPIDGTLVALDVATGETVEEGKPMFDVIDLDRVWLVVQVFEPDVPRVENARTAWFTIEGYDQPFTVDETNATLVTIGRVIDPKTRTVPVIFDVDNRDGRLRIGNFTKVVLATGAPRRALAIPEAAIVEDAGKAVAYVMVEGEAFEQSHWATRFPAAGRP